MFSDPWIIGGASVGITAIVVAAGVRIYFRIKRKLEDRFEAKMAKAREADSTSA